MADPSLTQMTVPLRARLHKPDGFETTTEAEFVKGQYTCPAATSATGRGIVWHLPPNLQVVYGQVQGKLAWKALVGDIYTATWEEAWPEFVPPLECPRLLHVFKFNKVMPGDGSVSHVIGHRFH